MSIMIPGMIGAGLMAAGGVPIYLTSSADFDGTNDYMRRVGSLTGEADSKAGTLSCWFRLDGGNATSLTILANATTLAGSTTRVHVFRNTSNGFQFSFQDSAGVTILTFVSSSTSYTSGVNWHHLLASWNLAASQFQLYVDDVADASTPSTLTNSNIDYTVADWSVGARPSGDVKFNGCLAELYFNIASSMDLSVKANRRKFRTEDGRPVSLGADGSFPTGSPPIIYQKIASGGVASDFATNRGSGGNFTVTGSLDIGSSSPSD